nr:hypothetical protein CFP56_58243 [Quercus suber]
MAWIEYAMESRGRAAVSPSALATTRGKVALLLIATLGLLTFYMYTYPSSPALLPFQVGESQVTLPSANLHLLIPASHPDVNLCKVLVSAAILGYPSPVIINWNTSFHTHGQVDGGSHLAKISGVYEYLSHLNSTHDEDIVLLVDGYDIWMQLRPQVLIDRYFDINRRADQRIHNELGETADIHDIRQEVIFGCQKRCWPWTARNPPCYAVPKSDLPEDIFGPRTDTLVNSKENPYIKYRPRYLNSGVGMGSVRAMRKLFHQAFKQAKYERNFGSDQYILSHIFGDQELWREALRRDARNVSSHYHGEHDHFNAKHIASVRKKAASRPDKNFEFGLGVDYGSEIALNTVFAEDDTDWLVFNNNHQLQSVQKARKIPGERQRANELAPDIAAGLPPFAALPAAAAPDDEPAWQDVALFTDVWTGITPAVIHHNAHRDGLKSLRETWWPLIWFQTRARALLDAYGTAPATPMAISGYDEATRREWWPYETRKGGARDGLGDAWIGFDETCQEYQGELFRDEPDASSLVEDEYRFWIYLGQAHVSTIQLLSSNSHPFLHPELSTAASTVKPAVPFDVKGTRNRPWNSSYEPSFRISRRRLTVSLTAAPFALPRPSPGSPSPDFVLEANENCPATMPDIGCVFDGNYRREKGLSFVDWRGNRRGGKEIRVEGVNGDRGILNVVFSPIRYIDNLYISSYGGEEATRPERLPARTRGPPTYMHSRETRGGPKGRGLAAALQRERNTQARIRGCSQLREAILVDHVTSVVVALALDDLTVQHAAGAGVAGAHLSGALRIAAEVCRDEAWPNAPDLDAVGLQAKRPIEGEHVERDLGAAVADRLEGGGGLGPAGGLRLGRVALAAVEGGDLRQPGDEEQARVRGPQEQRHEGVGREVRAGDVDVVGAVEAVAQ